MPYTTNVAGTVITAAWANSNIRDQVVTPFASTGARDSAITSPVSGMLAMIQSGNYLEGIYTRLSAGVWRPGFWNMAGGYLGNVVYTPANFTFTNVAANSASFSPTLLANRRYIAVGYIEVQNAAATGTVDTVTLWDSTGGAVLATIATTTPPGANGQDGRAFAVQFTSPGAGVRNLAIRAVSSLASATQTIANISVSIYDLGPAGNPA